MTEERIYFKINGEQYSVGSEVSSDLTLLDYIRNEAGLKGTKYMCREAGCGACIVTSTKGPGFPPMSVNSCMVSVTSCQDWEITTIEKVGNKVDGYHPIQTTLAKFNGTQCGYCTPGWVMSMYSLMQSKKDLTMLEIEKSFGSNICRCTGYRPILEAFKKFAKDSPNKIEIPDIEDLKICDRTGRSCKKDGSCKKLHSQGDHVSNCNEDEADDWCLITKEDATFKNVRPLPLKDGRKWYKAFNISDIFSAFFQEGNDSYMLICGNTAKGAYPILEYPRVLIDISMVAELKGYVLDQNLIIGANVTLTELLDIFETISTYEYFAYLQQLHEHLSKVAHIPVRNIGSLAGNLMIKHEHNEFPSDLFLLLETVGADLTLLNALGQKQIVSMQQFLSMNMRGWIILNVMFPPYSTNYKLITFKIMPRSQSAHAMVNAGFLYKMNGKTVTTSRIVYGGLSPQFVHATNTEGFLIGKDLFRNETLQGAIDIMPRSQSAHAMVNAGFLYKLNGTTVTTSRIVYGGLSPQFIHATNTEGFLIGKDLFRNETLQGAIDVLKQEMIVTENPPEPSAKFRKMLAINLFYKGLLNLCPSNKLDSKYKSGVTKIHESRPVSNGKQTYDTDPTLWPLNQPIPKIEALIQCAGEAEYSEDIPKMPREVFAAFVLSTVSKGSIVSIEPSQALKEPGVLQFYTAKDIPGVNSFTPVDHVQYMSHEEILCDGEVKYYNQPIGIIVAETRPIAEKAAKLVNVIYEDEEKPVIDVKEAKKIPSKTTLAISITATDTGTDIKKVIKSENTIYGQYHFTMETLVSVTKPIEEGLDVHVASQGIDGVQSVISKALNIDQNRIDVTVRRIGGGYGMKLTRVNLVAIAGSLVSTKLNRPCRFITPLTTVMRAVGKRFPCSLDFEVAVNDSGKVQYLNYDIYEDNGYVLDEFIAAVGFDAYYNCYEKSRWNFRSYNTITDTASNTACRAPGSLEAIAMAECIMEQISYEMSLDPIDVRLANIDKKFDGLKQVIDRLKTEAKYKERKEAVEKFNEENRWKKRGLRFVPLKWSPVGSQTLDVNLSVFKGDGTVVITHGGIEMGQGINTKAVQIAAHLLKIPMEKIQIKPNNTTIAPNSSQTGGSITSQGIGIGIQKCCEQLLLKLEPVKSKMNNPSWEELIKKAFSANVDLQVHGYTSLLDVQIYKIFGATLAEVELDVLTGEFEIIRVDIIQDVGQSVSPELDVGQVEGAFVMGLGYWTSEHLVYNKKTGELLSDRTWSYYVPQARDIPQDFRVYFRKNSYSSKKFFGAKGSGEPPMCMSIVIPFAIREAIAAARADSGIPTTKWFEIDGPYTTESILLATETKPEEFKFS